MPPAELTRLRWRLRGAWQWPAFVVATAIEAVTLDALPISGRGPGGLVPALLLATGLNLVAVAGLAPLAGALVRRRRRDLPRAIATDYCGAVLVAALFAALLVAGAVNHSAVARDDRDRAAAVAATASFVHSQAPGYLAGLERTSALRVGTGLYRTCVPGRDPERPLCVFVTTDQSPAGVTRDRDRIPNALWQR